MYGLFSPWETDVISATMEYKKAHKKSKKEYKIFNSMIKALKRSPQMLISDTTRKIIEGEAKVLRQSLMEEKEKHDAMISVMNTRYQEENEGSRFYYITDDLAMLGSFLRISFEFLYAVFLKRVKRTEI
jgi:hypothetical protein